MVAFLLWIYGINGAPEVRKTINTFLFVLLASIVILNWHKIEPLILTRSTFDKIDPVQSGGTKA